jgi:hypothetical protein
MDKLKEMFGNAFQTLVIIAIGLLFVALLLCGIAYEIAKVVAVFKIAGS